MKKAKYSDVLGFKSQMHFFVMALYLFVCLLFLASWFVLLWVLLAHRDDSYMFRAILPMLIFIGVAFLFVLGFGSYTFFFRFARMLKKPGRFIHVEFSDIERYTRTSLVKVKTYEGKEQYAVVAGLGPLENIAIGSKIPAYQLDNGKILLLRLDYKII